MSGKQLTIDFTPDLDQAHILGREGMEIVEENAGETFGVQARACIPAILKATGRDMTGEDIVDVCKAVGIQPHDDRAFGPVFKALAGDGVILNTGYTTRRKGHGANGTVIWKLLTTVATLAH